MPIFNEIDPTQDAMGVTLDVAGARGVRFDSRGRRRTGTTTKPTVAAGAGAGTGATASVVGTDEVGTVTVTGAGTPAAGVLATITFADAFATTPHVVITPQDADGAAKQLYAVATTTTLTISSGVAIATGAHNINYMVVGGA